ncbi:hypothetical protein [Pyxidicoccus xibeiensis]|uniref:hypothetical protein n=1 Tax=Pyxidicoccus xibeiensis TaxID=2906759 RepID=UPI0020A71CA4|nr:hypothetical protein [Pyxidicoccus xibeiensis]MCP3142379.1 hypothetical protein [Pyxidicoccus xibeiensis]
MGRRAGWMGVAAVLVGVARPALAFKASGHDIIEAQAYRALAEGSTRYDDGLGGEAEGRQVLEDLMEAGILKGARCFPVYSKERVCPPGEAARALDWWPRPWTGHSDMVFSRQFGPVGQCYHFLGRRSDERLGQDRGLGEVAFSRCMGTLRELMNVVAGADPLLAHGLNNGIYELLHAVGDSFSSAHAERAEEGTGAVQWLRTWNMVPLFQRPNPTLRHDFDDARDQRFLDVSATALAADPACEPDSEHPYTFKRECLSTEARAAVNGLRELLVVAWRVRNRMAGACRGQVPLECPDNLRDWEAYEARYLRPPPPPGLAASDVKHGYRLSTEDLDAFPVAHVGLVGAVGMTGRGTTLGGRAVLPLTMAPDKVRPLLPSVGLMGGGWWTEAGRSSFVGELDVTLSLPFSEYFSLGVSPYRVTYQPGEDPALHALFGTPQLDVFLASADVGLPVWLRFTGPVAYDVFEDEARWFAALTVGVHVDHSLRIPTEVREQGSGRKAAAQHLREQSLDAEEPGTLQVDSARRWEPPPLEGLSLPKHLPRKALYLDAGATTRGGVVTGLTFLADVGTERTPWRWAVGGRLFADGRGPRERGRTRYGVSPELRLYPLRFLGVVVDPAEGTWAPAAGSRASASGSGTKRVGLGGRAGLALRWEVLQAVVRAPPFSYSRRVWERSAGLELSLGLDFAPLLEID